MTNTLIGPASCAGAVIAKQLVESTYTIPPADLAAGLLRFRFEFTNGLSALRNPNTGECLDHVEAAPERIITVVAGPTCAITSPSTNICQRSSANFTATGSGPVQPYDFIWTGPGGFTHTDSNVLTSTITISNAQAVNEGTYSAFVVDSLGSNNTCTTTLTVTPTPTCTIENPAPFCGGATNVHTSTVLPAAGMATHSWTITGDGTIQGSATGASVTVVAGASGSYTVTDNVTRDGCPGVCSLTVNINPNPTCTISNPGPFCEGTTNVHTSTVLPAGGMVTHDWAIMGEGTIQGSTTDASVTVVAGASGSYTVTDNITRDGCPGVCSLTVNVNPNPTCTISNPGPFCGGTTNVHTSTVLPAGGTVTHSWAITGDGTIQGLTIDASVTVVAGATGSYTLTDNIIRDGCPGVCATTVSIIFCPPPPCTPHKARATAQLVNGFVVGATITDAGCGYTNAPVVLIQGGGGTGATARAVITDGMVTSIQITGAGCCYTSTPEIVIGSPPFVPTVSIAVNKVKVTQNVVLGWRYVLESSTNNTDWTPTGPEFTAESETIVTEFDVDMTGRFFRLRVVP